MMIGWMAAARSLSSSFRALGSDANRALLERGVGVRAIHHTSKAHVQPCGQGIRTVLGSGSRAPLPHTHWAGRSFHSSPVPFAASEAAKVPDLPGNATRRTKTNYKAPPEPLAAPWTPTRLLKKRKHLTKRMGHLMQALSDEAVAGSKAQGWPEFNAGDLLELKVITPENNRRVSTVKGICIARRNRGIGSMFTIRNIIDGVGIERQFPLHSPHLVDLKVIGSRKVRRAKLFYLRNMKPALSRV